MTFAAIHENGFRSLAGFALSAVFLLAACGDDDDDNASLALRDGGSSMSAIEGAEDNTPEQTACQDADLGTPCGDGKHCVGDRCVVNTCGDGVRAEDEECDDGNVAIDDGCGPNCRAEPTGCGNAQRDGEEECDDGNRIDQDECSNTCMENECGNGRIDVAEECDDDNRDDEDECSNECLSVRCRNGRVDPGEQCDDGNQIDTDGCTNMCRTTSCGNKQVEKYEECDDGNEVDTDKCSNRCTKNECGNARVDPGEECDGETTCDPVKCVRVADLCTPCEEQYCRSYMGTDVDVLGGCREGKIYMGMLPDEPIPDPKVRAKECTDVLDCVRANKCAITAESSCYCGSASTEECIQIGPKESPCLDEYIAAAHSTKPDDVITRMVDLAYPLGMATYLLQCDYDNCREQCLPGSPGPR